MESFVVDPQMQYADIIVPTADTVRASFILELLLTNEKQVTITKQERIHSLSLISPHTLRFCVLDPLVQASLSLWLINC